MTITGDAVYYTLTSVQHGLADSYSFADIARDSPASTQSTAAGCVLEVHPMKVDFEQVLAAIRTDVARTFGVEDFEQLRGLATEKPSLSFHERLAALFRRAGDSNLMYRAPWSAAFKWYNYRSITEGQPIVLRVRPPLANGVPVVEVKLDWAFEDSAFKEVVELDDRKAWQWLLDQAEHVGNFRSRGARLNWLLSGWANARFEVTKYPLPSVDVLRIKFADGSNTSAVAHVAPAKELAGSTQFQLEFDSARDFELLKPWLASRRELRPPEAAAVALATEPGAQAVAEGARLFDSPRPRPSLDRASMRRLGSSATLVGKWPGRVLDAFQIPPLFVGYWLEDSKTAILKVPSLEPYASVAGMTGIQELSLSSMYEGLWELHGKLVEKAGDSGRLILDLSDNDGGSTELANVLVQMLAPRLENRTLLCNEYAVRLTPFWQEWLASFGGKWDDVLAHVGQLPEAELDSFMNRIIALEELAAALRRPLPIRSGSLEALKVDYMMSRTVEEKRKHVLDRIQRRDFVFNSAEVGSRLFGRGSRDGWYPFTGSVLDPTTGEVFDPKLKPYREPVERRWGGSTGNYTQRFLFSCNQPFLLSKWGKHKHQWKELAVLTNGLCGHACSLLASKLQFAAGATVFTHGGVPGEMMDSSASAGGDVVPWDMLWPDVLFAGLIGDVLHGPNTSVGQRLRATGARERLFGDTLLLPLPTRARVSYSYHMMFLKELGPDALPREWYSLPGHRHYDQWVFASGTDDATWGPLHQLWSTVAREDWEAVRKAGAFNGAKPEMYGCAAAPPTEPWVNPEEPDDSGWEPPDDKPVKAPAISVGTVFMWIGFLVGPCIIGILIVVVMFRKAKRAEEEFQQATRDLETAVDQRNAREPGRGRQGGQAVELRVREVEAT